MIFFTTDHGIPFPGAKCHLNDAGTGVAIHRIGVQIAEDDEACLRRQPAALALINQTLDEALAGIGAYLPLVLVESLDVYPARAARGKDEAPGQQVKANLQLLSLRAIQ